MVKIIKVGGETYISTNDKPKQRRTRYKRETRYGSIFGRNARQRVNLAEDRLKEIRLKSKLQKEKRVYEVDRRNLRKIQRKEASDKRKAFFHKIKNANVNTHIHNPIKARQEHRRQEAIKEAEHNQQVQQQRQKNFRNAFEASRES